MRLFHKKKLFLDKKQVNTYLRLQWRLPTPFNGFSDLAEGAKKGNRRSLSRQSRALFYLAIFMGLLLVSCGQTERVKQERPLAVRTGAVRLAKVTKTATYVGTVYSETEITVLARVAGRLEHLPFSEGTRVKKGRIVARLDSQDLAAAAEQTSAQIRGAMAEKKYRCHWASVRGGLEKKGYLSRSNADASRKACNAAKAALLAARAGRRRALALQNKTIERSPIDAVVLKKLVKRGENTLPGRPLMILGGKEKEIRVWVSQDDVNAGISLSTEVLLEGAGGESRMKVTRLVPRANPSTHLFEMGIRVPEKLSHGLRHGTAITVHFVIKESRGLVVPVESVLKRSKGTTVYRVQKGRVTPVVVREIFRNEKLVRVRGALESGDLLAVTNLSSLRDGVSVLDVSQVTQDQ